MAKMVKCPTCGTQIEVPAMPTGQVVKCPGCGKGLKLVAKKPPGAAGGAAVAGGGKEGSRGSGSPGASVAGGSVTAMSFAGEPPPLDDLPNLESCAVCGRPTDFNRLVEDNGKLVCPDCIKGARSKIGRSTEAPPDTLGLGTASYRPTKRAKLITVTPGLIGFVLAALVWAGCQFYLSSHNKPVGTAMAKPTKPGKSVTARPGAEPAPSTAPGPTETAQATQPAEVAQATPATEPAPAEPGPRPAPTTTEVAVAPTPPVTPDNPPTPPPPTPGSVVFPQDQPDKTQGPPGSSADLTNADALIVRGAEKLKAKDYPGAKAAFDAARLKYVTAGRLPPPGRPLTPEQSLSLSGLAAANLGVGKPEDAEAQLGVLLTHNEFSRAIALNAAMVAILRAKTLPDFAPASVALRRYIDSAPGPDEYAADVFGTLLSKMSALRNIDRTLLEQHWAAYDQYVERIASASGHEGQLKWGVEWVPAEEAKANRQARMMVAGLTPQQAGRALEVAQNKLRAATKVQEDVKLKQAQGRATADMISRAQLDVDTATRAVDDARRDMAALSAAAKPPKWLDKFEPASP